MEKVEIDILVTHLSHVCLEVGRFFARRVVTGEVTIVFGTHAVELIAVTWSIGNKNDETGFCRPGEFKDFSKSANYIFCSIESAITSANLIM